MSLLFETEGMAPPATAATGLAAQTQGTDFRAAWKIWPRRNRARQRLDFHRLSAEMEPPTIPELRVRELSSRPSFDNSQGLFRGVFGGFFGPFGIGHFVQ
jgi:tRNA U34 5-methylaminomethyl-2-thiouridine-forming methyltransferase MnmC